MVPVDPFLRKNWLITKQFLLLANTKTNVSSLIFTALNIANNCVYRVSFKLERQRSINSKSANKEDGTHTSSFQSVILNDSRR